MTRKNQADLVYYREPYQYLKNYIEKMASM